MRLAPAFRIYLIDPGFVLRGGAIPGRSSVLGNECVKFLPTLLYRGARVVHTVGYDEVDRLAHEFGYAHVTLGPCKLAQHFHTLFVYVEVMPVHGPIIHKTVCM